MAKKIDFLNISYDDKDYIRHLIPGSLLEELCMPGQFALAIGVVDEENDRNELVGATSFYVDVQPGREHFLSIRWFYIAPEYRKSGYARALFDKVCELAKQNNVKDIRVLFPEIEEVIPLKYVFYEMDFTYRTGNIVEVYSSISQLVPDENSEKNVSPSGYCVPLSQVSETKFNKVYSLIPENRKYLDEYMLPMKLNEYDTDVSHVIFDQKGDIEAVFLFRYLNEALEPVLFYSITNTKPVLMAELLLTPASVMRQKYGKDVIFRLRSTEVTEWSVYEKLLPKISKDDKLISVIENDLRYSIQGHMLLE